MHKERSRIAVFFWEGYLGVAPSLINAVDVLSQNGYGVDIITRPNAHDYPAPPDFPSNVNIFVCRPLKLGIVQWFSRLGTRKKDQAGLPDGFRSEESPLCGIRKFAHHFYHWIWLIIHHLQFTLFGLRHTWRSRYACFIGIDMEGLVAAASAAFFKRTPFIYWSLEMKYLDELEDPLMRMFKKLQRFHSRRAALTIIQDKWRADSLTEENKMEVQCPYCS